MDELNQSIVPPAPGVHDPEERLRLIFENAKEFAIITMDLDLAVTSWNPGATRILGYTEAEIIGGDSRRFFTPEDRADLQPEKERDTAISAGRAEDERWHMRKDESRFWGSGAAMPLRTKTGEVYGILKIMRDLTERKIAEDALKQSETRLREANETLERRVRERTEQLHAEIAERTRLERAALEASEREQRRMGQDLHDTLCQQLAGLSLACKAIARRLAPHRAEDAKEIEHVGDLLIASVNDTRTIARGLHPLEFERAGLTAALVELADYTNNIVPCTFTGHEPSGLNPFVGLHLFRIAQEAVSNALKHAGATAIEISLSGDGVTVLRVSDNGKGFEPEEAYTKSMGLGLMRYRASVLGANLTVSSAPGAGTAVECVARTGG